MNVHIGLEKVKVEALLIEGVERDALLLLGLLCGKAAELSVLLVDDKRIAELNAQWRSVEGATDVLSFPQGDEVLLGDLVISVDTAQRQGEARGHSLEVELRILLLHGLLHLLGFDHEKGEDDHREMAEREAEVMAELGWEGKGLVERLLSPA